MLDHCFASLGAKWKSVVKKNGALQLAFGLLFAVGSKEWRVSCFALAVVQLVGLVGNVVFLTNEIQKHTGELAGSPTIALIVTEATTATMFHLSLIVSYVFAAVYVCKHSFVANVGMEFPCPPPTPRCTSAHSLESANTDSGRASYQSSTNHDPCNASETTGKAKMAVNSFSVVFLAAPPVLWVVAYTTHAFEHYPGSPAVFTIFFVQSSFAVFGVLVMCLVFASVTQTVIEQISTTSQLLLSPNSFKQSVLPGNGSSSLIPQVVAEIELLKQKNSAWLGTLSTWFILHQFCSLVFITGRLYLIIEKPPVSLLMFEFLSPSFIIWFALPLICASAVTRQWDHMADQVLTSQEWLPDHWQEHMYLRQFLERSPGGFYVFGFRVSGSIFVSIVAVGVGMLGALYRY